MKPNHKSENRFRKLLTVGCNGHSFPQMHLSDGDMELKVESVFAGVGKKKQAMDAIGLLSGIPELLQELLSGC